MKGKVKGERRIRGKANHWVRLWVRLQGKNQQSGEKIKMGRIRARKCKLMLIQIQVQKTSYVDSDNCSYINTNEEADITGGRRRSKYPSYDPRVQVPSFSVSLTFREATEFKEALSKYEIMTRHQLKFTKNTKQYVRMQC